MNLWPNNYKSMKNTKKWQILLIIPAILLLGACSVDVKTKDGSGTDGGIFISNTKGDVWKQLTAVPTISGVDNISNINITKMYMDPSDSSAVYLATEKNGLFYTYNIARGWNKIYSLPDRAVNDLAIDKNNKCILFVAMENKLHKSVDCGRTFIENYYDNNIGVHVTAVAVDHYNSNNVFIGTSRGDVLRSLDGGFSWRAIQRLNNSIKKILINPQDSRSIFVATAVNGIYRFNSNGGASLEQLEEYRNKFDNANWTDYNETVREFNLGTNFKDLIFSAQDNSLLLATDKVILRSYDEGSSWLRLSLLTPEIDSTITSILVNPQDSKELFYVTNTSYYRSVDNGDNWSVKKLPSTRSASSLIIDFTNPNIMYLSLKKLAK